ncbi:MAG: hypothetical protein V7767_12640 [Leeuwenhoekiella sp.]
MKILVTLLSFLTLFLSAVPCCSKTAEDRAEHQTCEESSDCDDIPCEGPCSPFYTCGSCTGFSVQEVAAFTFILDQLIDQKIVSIISFHREDYQSPSFKPPRTRLKIA